MAILDIFKKKRRDAREEKFREKAKEDARLKEKTPDARAQKESNGEDKSGARLLYESELASEVIVAPVITEKSTNLSAVQGYAFHVQNDAGKTEIKKAIEELYRVRVKKVRVISVKPKNRLWRGIHGKKPGYKKAIVTLSKGEKIEFV